ncbi:MAG: hypothetical protein ACE5KU_05080 [Nitrososphaerales archaeon]
MSNIEPHTSDFRRLKTRVEQMGLLLSLAGLASILQPFNLTIYTYGFYILILGAAVYFLGSTIPEEAKIGRAFLQIASFFTLFIVIILLAVYLAPLLVT